MDRQIIGRTLPLALASAVEECEPVVSQILANTIIDRDNAAQVQVAAEAYYKRIGVDREVAIPVNKQGEAGHFHFKVTGVIDRASSEAHFSFLAELLSMTSVPNGYRRLIRRVWEDRLESLYQGEANIPEHLRLDEQLNRVLTSAA